MLTVRVNWIEKRGQVVEYHFCGVRSNWLLSGRVQPWFHKCLRLGGVSKVNISTHTNSLKEIRGKKNGKLEDRMIYTFKKIICIPSSGVDKFTQLRKHPREKQIARAPKRRPLCCACGWRYDQAQTERKHVHKHFLSSFTWHDSFPMKL